MTLDQYTLHVVPDLPLVYKIVSVQLISRSMVMKLWITVTVMIPCGYSDNFDIVSVRIFNNQCTNFNICKSSCKLCTSLIKQQTLISVHP